MKTADYIVYDQVISRVILEIDNKSIMPEEIKKE